MTDAEKAARQWLERLLEGCGEEGHPGRTLLALLAEPRLPAEPTSKALFAMGMAAYGQDAPAPMRDAYRALYAEMTKPATKTVEVWRVEYAYKTRRGWEARIEPALSAKAAEGQADFMRNAPLDYAHIHITGPHTQEVPND